jgi:hypothetical protein
METLSQSVSSSVTTATESRSTLANIIVVIDDFFNNCISWCANHPKVATTVGIFLFGFLLGLLF